ncbi:FAD-dependent oxidoreductase [Arthrobacter sp. zg-Y40]|uniref:FAD-dependent oxidoreductase n=1 Tax=Arthrobacter sp. zg-Y40 TaxID=2886939 RepID=UPI001D159D6C|nr:FAD-dependent oxidoreductase [Arthrobacter sp. zg-Y40]MCC3279078.1 FAD-dependent oxidoreductase [Arthrobacter sp. zg-Y40]
MPGDEAFTSARQVENPRFDGAEPLAVLSAASADDVAEGVMFANASGVPLALRSGGHSYAGHSSGDSALVIDVRALSAISVAADGSATIGAGARLIQVYEALGQQGRALAAGSCATVGITGLTLGGGVGVLTRAFGLTSDALRSVEMVSAEGMRMTASADENPDILWACRGGGGQVGVLTSLTFDTVPAPTITTAFLEWSFADAVPVILAWQAWAPDADPRLWSTLKLLSGGRHAGPAIQLTATWIGPSSELDANMAGLHQGSGVLPTVNSVQPDRTYQDVMFSFAGCAGGVSAEQCTTGAGGLLQREAFSATSHVPTDLLDRNGAAALVERCMLGQQLAGAREVSVSLDALGGAVRDLHVETGFAHRDAYATVQYTATFEDSADPAPYDVFVRESRAAMEPWWGTGAYVNYLDPSITDPGAAYFGSNAARLADIRSSADPSARFALPGFAAV